MNFDQNYFALREEALKWLRRSPQKRDYAEGVSILERIGFKPQLTYRLKLCANNPMMMRTLVKTVTDAVNVYRAPNSPKFADVIPAEVAEATSGAMPPAPEEKPEKKTTSWPETVKTVMKWYRDAYVRRDRLHREMRAVGDQNDSTSMARRRNLSDRINDFTNYMDALWPLREDYNTTGTIPTLAQLKAIGAFDVWAADHSTSTPEPPKKTPAQQYEDAASFRLRDEDFSKMDVPELRKRKASIRTMLVKKQNQLLYQSDGKKEKENPMPPCPERTKLEKQVVVLKDKLYKVEKALAAFG